ncbi:PadR family transcriptional regulator, partial [Clostridioides difficile]|nr:PadR family transcriptional regulator [Clostridioides difficile]
TYDQPYQCRNRRYYQITEQGRIRLLELLKEWQMYKEKVDCVLLGGNLDG